jgi:hypothetical protein
MTPERRDKDGKTRTVSDERGASEDPEKQSPSSTSETVTHRLADREDDRETLIDQMNSSPTQSRQEKTKTFNLIRIDARMIR